MAIAFVNSGAKGEAASGNVALGAPASPQVNDVWIAVVHSSDNVAHTFTDWTQIAQGNGGGVVSRLSVWRFRYAGVAPNLTVTHAAGGPIVGGIASFRGVRSWGSPIHIQSALATGSDASIEHTGITPFTSGVMLIAANGAGDDNARTIPPTGFTSAFEDATAGTQNCYVTTLGVDGSSACHYRLQATAAATGTLTDTQAAADPWASVLFALHPELPVDIVIGGNASVFPGTAPTPSYPTGLLAGDLLLLLVGNKHPPNGPSTPAGWTFLVQSSGGAGASAADSGDTYTSAYYKIADGTETGTLTLTITGASCSSAVMYAYRTTFAAWSIAATTASDNSAGTSLSFTGAADPGYTQGDWAVFVATINTDAFTLSANSFTATGVTIDAVYNHNSVVNGNGNQQRFVYPEPTGSSVQRGGAQILSGTSSAAPIYTATASGSDANSPAGSALFIRLRGVVPSASAVLDANIGTITLGATGALAIAGSLSQSIGDITLVAAGTIVSATPSGTLSQSIGEITLASAATLRIAGTLTASIGTVTLGATGKLAIAGSLSKSIGEVTLVTTGKLAIAGALSRSIGEVTLASAASLKISGALSASIGEVILSAIGTLSTGAVFSRFYNRAIATLEEGRSNVGLVAVQSLATGRSESNATVTRDNGSAFIAPTEGNVTIA